jgi:NADH-quinone oxidoreductase subunit J
MAWAVFAVVALLAVLFAVGLVARPNPLHGALCLVGNLFCVAILYLTLRAEFLALAQVIVYAGAIMVLFIFAIMLLLPGKAETGPDPLRSQRMLALPVGGALGLVMVVVLAQAAGPVPSGEPVAVGLPALGRLLFREYLLPFEVTSVLLLAALIGALSLAKRRSP